MAKKQTAKERREANKAKIMAERLDKANRKLRINESEIVESSVNKNVTKEPDIEEIIDDSVLTDEHYETGLNLDNNKESSRPILNKKNNRKEPVQKKYNLDEMGLSEARRIFEKNRRNREWQRMMPAHEMYDVPDFLIDIEKSAERKDVAEKLSELLKTKFSLSTIADILLYNDYENLNNIVKDKRMFLKTIKNVYPQFSFKFNKKVGSENSRAYSTQERKMKILIDFLESGTFLESGDTHTFQDAVSSIVDTAEFNEACIIESEFMDAEIQEFLDAMPETELSELEQLAAKAIELRKDLQYRTDAYQTITRLIEGKTNDTLEKDIR